MILLAGLKRFVIRKRGNNMSYEDRIYHSGYLDGYYASMELYHSDEMTDEEKIQKALEEDRKARRKRRRRNFAIRTAVGLGLSGVGAYAYNKAKEAERAERDAAMNRSMNDLNDWVKTVRSTMRKSAPKPKRTVKGFRKTAGTYKVPSTRTYVPTWALERARKHPNTIRWRT